MLRMLYVTYGDKGEQEKSCSSQKIEQIFLIVDIDIILQMIFF